MRYFLIKVSLLIAASVAKDAFSNVRDILVEPVRFVAPLDNEEHRQLCHPNLDCGGQFESILLPTNWTLAIVSGERIYPILQPTKLQRIFSEKIRANFSGTVRETHNPLTAAIMGLPSTTPNSGIVIKSAITEFSFGHRSKQDYGGILFGLIQRHGRQDFGFVRTNILVLDQENGRYIDAFQVEDIIAINEDEIEIAGTGSKNYLERSAITAISSSLSNAAIRIGEVLKRSK